MSESVIAQVILRAPDGSSMLDAEEGITSGNVARYQASAATVRQASDQLKAYGFEVVQAGPHGLTIAGGVGLFESVFGTRLERRGATAEGPGARVAAGPSYELKAPIRVPPELSAVVAGIALPVAPELFP